MNGLIILVRPWLSSMENSRRRIEKAGTISSFPGVTNHTVISKERVILKKNFL